MTVTRAEILDFLNRGPDESKKLREDEVEFLRKLVQPTKSGKDSKLTQRFVAFPKGKPLELPCLIRLPPSYGKKRSERLRWIYYDEHGKLKMSDEEPRFRKAKVPNGHEEEESPQTPDSADEVVDASRGDIDDWQRRADGLPIGWAKQFGGTLAAELGIDPDKVHGITRGWAGIWLVKQGLSAEERELVLAYVFDGLRRDSLAKSIGRKKSWVSQKLRNHLIKKCVAQLQAALQDAKPLTPCKAKRLGRAVELQNAASEEYLSRLNVWRSFACSLVGIPKADEIGRRIPKHLTADNVVSTIRDCPSLLLTSTELLKAFVDLLEAARFGLSERRVLSDVGKDKRARNKTSARARQQLAPLITPVKGSTLGHPAKALWNVVDNIRWCIRRIQDEWREFRTSRQGTEAGKLEQFHRFHFHELEGYNDKKLYNLLHGDALSLAATYAEKATGISAETFIRCYRKIESPKR